jgi:hypothetical protein
MVNILTISAFIMTMQPATRNTLVMILGLLEMLRRSIWNVIRMEYVHLEHTEHFRATEKYILPFDKLGYDIDESCIFKFEIELHNIKSNEHSEDLAEEWGKEKQFHEKINPYHRRNPLNYIAPEVLDGLSGKDAIEYNRKLEYVQKLKKSDSGLEKMAVPDFPLKWWVQKGYQFEKEIIKDAKIFIDYDANKHHHQGREMKPKLVDYLIKLQNLTNVDNSSQSNLQQLIIHH